jgi:hypothetical protein
MGSSLGDLSLGRHAHVLGNRYANTSSEPGHDADLPDIRLASDSCAERGAEPVRKFVEDPASSRTTPPAFDADKYRRIP